MPADLLLVTPSSSYGETIRRTLDDTNFYRVHIVNNKASAIVRADEVGVPLAMLDIALGDDWVREIGIGLRTVRPSINLAILCEEQGDPPAFDSLRPWIMVRKPFRMAEFMNAISHASTITKPFNSKRIIQYTNDDAVAQRPEQSRATPHTPHTRIIGASRTHHPQK
ncbi:MAG: hypothetical protein HC797_06665 [Anaerolineales bacterium]|nr:hypothetical protein [Anaerolineales bacterium]